MVSKLNLYFFGEKEIAKSDSIWFYGMIGVSAVIGVFSLIVGNIGI